MTISFTAASLAGVTPNVGGGGPAPSSGMTKKQAACAADVAINFGLGFIPGYNAVKLIGTAAGLNFNFVQNGMSGKSIITTGPTIFSSISALASGYNLVSQTAYQSAGGQLLETAGRELSDLGKIASTAGTIANLANVASAGYDLYQCRNAR